MFKMLLTFTIDILDKHSYFYIYFVWQTIDHNSLSLNICSPQIKSKII